jgi:2-octaprenyl-6-methoxyphenol hydroxylase
MKQHYDILIVGAGIVGSSLVLALSHLPLRVALIEKTSFKLEDFIPTAESKAIALNHASMRILRRLLPWTEVSAYANPIETVHISEQGCFASARIKAREMGVSALGAVVPAAKLGWTVNKALAQLATQTSKKLNLTLFNPAQCQALLKTEQGWEALIASKEGALQTLCAPLMIAADGSHSVVRQLLAIDVQSQSEEQVALVTTLNLARHHHHVAYQRFTDQGILACLPLLGNKVGFVWTATKTIIEQRQSLTESEFLACVQQLFAYRIGRFLARGLLSVYPVESFIAQPQAQTGLILLGNAAHTLSPIAAQGLNLALQDMAELVDILTQAVETKKALADSSITQTYLAARLPQQKQLIRFTENLGKLFKQKFLPLTLLRNSGLLAFDLVTPVKRNVSRHLMGIHGRLPSLARGVVHQQEEEYVEI